MRLRDQVAIVTGAGRGIGRAIAERLAAEGAKVALAARTLAQLRETADSIRDASGKSLVVPVDVTDGQAVASMVREVEQALGPIDLLVNNAGRFQAIGPAWEVDGREWWADVTANILGVFHGCRATIPGMVARGKGRVINMIGGGTGSPLPYGSGYATSKAAVMRFTECLAAELKGEGVSVFAMGPGLVRTTMTEFQVESPEGRRWLARTSQAFQEGRDVPPTRAAGLAAELASGRFDVLTGRLFNVSDDLDRVEKQIGEILEKDLRTLRMR